MKFLSIGRSVVATAAVFTFLTTGYAFAGISFKGKVVQLVVASNPGGGTDRVGRLLSQGFEKYLPGRPTVIIKNTGAGGGKIRGANMLMKAKPDGLTVMQSDSNLLQPSTVARRSAHYDPKKFCVVGAINRGGSVLFYRKASESRLKDKSKKPLIVGAISGARSWQAMPMWGAEWLGWNLRWVPGYSGSGEMTKAIRQGEIDMFSTNNVYIINELLKDRVVNLLAQAGQPMGKTYGPREDYPKVAIFPLMLEKAHPTKVAWQGYQSLMRPSQIDKWMALPPKTPQNILGAWRKAYAKITKDPKFLNLAHKQLSTDLTIMTGDQVEDMIQEVFTAGKKALDYADNLKRKYGLLAQ